MMPTNNDGFGFPDIQRATRRIIDEMWEKALTDAIKENTHTVSSTLSDSVDAGDLQRAVEEFNELFRAVDNRPVLFLLTDSLDDQIFRLPRLREVSLFPLTPDLVSEHEDKDPYKETYMMSKKTFEALATSLVAAGIWGEGILEPNIRIADADDPTPRRPYFDL